MTPKSLAPVKATVVDNDTFRLLAIPFGGPIPSKAAPRGMDLDGQWFGDGVDIKRDWFPVRLVDWHHREPGYTGDRLMRDFIAGKAILDEDLTPEEGYWVTVWLKHGERRVELIRKLAEKGAQLFGSSETLPGMGRIRNAKGQVVPWRRDVPGEIVEWPYVRQTLSSSPQNTYSVLRPLKATLADLASEGIPLTDAYFADLSRYLDDLVTRPSGDLSGEPDVKAGRVLAARNEARLREAADELETEGWNPVRRRQAIDKLASVLAELERYLDQ